MFELYTERARRALFFGRYEASQLGSLAIDTEHLLLGLIREGAGSAAGRAFARSGLDVEAVRREIERRSVFREKVPTSVEIPFSAEAKQVLHFTAEESNRLRHPHIGTEHLLLGILRSERSVAASILAEHGMRLESVRDGIVQTRDNDDSYPATVGPGSALRSGAPDITPSYELRVSLSHPRAQGQSTTGGPDYWTASGFTLRAIVARLFNTDERRIELSSHLDTQDRYDFALRLPAPEDWRSMERRALLGIERHFGVSMIQEPRDQEVYVLTASGGTATGLREDQSEQGGSGGGFASFDHATPASDMPPASAPMPADRVSFGNLRMSGLTIDDLCLMLEEMIGKPFVNETALTGRYDIAVEGQFDTSDGFFEAMRNQLGLVVTPSRRNIETIVVL